MDVSPACALQHNICWLQQHLISLLTLGFQPLQRSKFYFKKSDSDVFDPSHLYCLFFDNYIVIISGGGVDLNLGSPHKRPGNVTEVQGSWLYYVRWLMLNSHTGTHTHTYVGSFIADLVLFYPIYMYLQLLVF